MVWPKSEKMKDICRYLQLSAGIFRYLPASSNICRHLQISSGIFRYLRASSDIFRHLRASSDICRCDPPLSKIMTCHKEYTKSLPAPAGSLKPAGFSKAWPEKPSFISQCGDCRVAGRVYFTVRVPVLVLVLVFLSRIRNLVLLRLAFGCHIAYSPVLIGASTSTCAGIKKHPKPMLLNSEISYTHSAVQQLVRFILQYSRCTSIVFLKLSSCFLVSSKLHFFLMLGQSC